MSAERKRENEEPTKEKRRTREEREEENQEVRTLYFLDWLFTKLCLRCWGKGIVNNQQKLLI